VPEAAAAELAELRTHLWSDLTLVVLQRPAGGQAAPHSGIEIREAEPGDAPAYERDIGTSPGPAVERRLGEPGSSCWIAQEGGRIVHASWVATQAAWLGEAARSFVVPPGDAYIYESFTRPEMRGRGVYPAVLITISKTLGQRGTRMLWIAAETTNVPSLRAIEKAGFTHSFEIRVRRRAGRVHVVVPPGVAPQLHERRDR
jgi:GNAT superfamily N-acetyltransferase